jgi:cobalt-zinc-cadmium efflux system protein
MLLRTKVSVCLVFNALIIAVEMLGGWWTGSVGLISDAVHNLIDQAGLFLTLYAVIMSAKPSTHFRTFGHHRIGTLAAFVNSVVLLFAGVGILALSIDRFIAPVSIPGLLMFGIALFSFAGNLSIALLLRREAHGDLNVRAAFWHNLGDAWVSLGVIATGLIVAATGWTLLDPIISVAIAVVILGGAWSILRESAIILLEGVPSHLDAARIAQRLAEVPGVVNIHDLHIWGLDAHLPSLTCHVLIHQESGAQSVLRTVRRFVVHEFGIKHITIQVETACCHPQELHCNVRTAYLAHPEVPQPMALTP